MNQAGEGGKSTVSQGVMCKGPGAGVSRGTGGSLVWLESQEQGREGPGTSLRLAEGPPFLLAT